MPTLETIARNASSDEIVDLIDGGSGPGTLRFETSGDVAVATLTFSDPSFGNSSGGTATANAITSDTNAAGGTIAKASAYDSTGAKIIEFTVGIAASGEDIEMSSLTIGAGDTVSVSSLTITTPASDA